MKKPDRRVVLITGASAGIGRACADHLHRCGYRVYGTSRRAPALDAEASRPDFSLGGGFEWIKMDVDVDSSVQRGIEWLLEREKRLDVLVNNAGFGIAGAIEDTSIQEARAQFETNFFGPLRLCRAVLPVMRAQQSGHIINISSLAGRVGAPFQGLYSASKFALEGLSEALRLELRPHGIQVVLVEPGDFVTSFPQSRRRTAASQTNPAYRQRFFTTLGIMEADESRGNDPIRVAHLLEKIIRNPSPRLRYTVGPGHQRLVTVLKKLVPSRLYEWGLAKYYRLDS